LEFVPTSLISVHVAPIRLFEDNVFGVCGEGTGHEHLLAFILLKLFFDLIGEVTDL
jgi:hypothetical protein